MKELLDHRGRPRVVVTGIGMIGPLGHTADESWDALINGRSGIGTITQFDTHRIPVTIAGEVKAFNPKEYMDFKDARRMSRASQLAVAAASMALSDAGLAHGLPNPERTGTLIGTGVGGFEWADNNMVKLRSQGYKRVSPFAMPAFLANMSSHQVSLMAGSTGPISTVVAACATGTQSIGEAAEFIRRGIADIVIAGGTEGLIHEASFAGFGRMGGLTANYNDDPARASRPFDKKREGFVVSEGSGVLILERLDHAVTRNVPIYAEFGGHASSSDAYHMAAQDPNAAGAIRAMRWALEDANVTLDQVDYINAHGTSTQMNDLTETMAIKTLFGKRAYKIPISSNKSLMGHMMGATGTVEAIFSIYAINNSIIPATYNYENPDPACDLDYVPNAPRTANVDTVLSNSFGLGGQNACLVMKKLQGEFEK